MYILFINSCGKCDIFFSAQFNNNSNKKKIFQPKGSTQPNLTHVGWFGLNFFLPTTVGWSKKSPQSDPCTPLGLIL